MSEGKISPNSSVLQGLLERVRAASGPDRELDARLYVQIVARLGNPRLERMIAEREASHPHENVWLSGARDWQVSRYTASVDAALALVERVLPAANCVGFDKTPRNADAYVSRNCVDSGHWLHEASAKTPTLAILSALLTALISQGGEAQ